MSGKDSKRIVSNYTALNPLNAKGVKGMCIGCIYFLIRV
jgi:hypothetical protein